MAWVRYTHARVSESNPEALGCCDRCGMDYNLSQLRWQLQWQGPKLQNLRILVCPDCYDAPQPQLRTIILPPDPLPVPNPRPDPYMYMGLSSSPPVFTSGQPNVLATQGGDWLTTQDGLHLITEITVTPTPTSSGFTARSTVSFSSL